MGRGVVDRPQTRGGRAKGWESGKGLDAGPYMCHAWTHALGAGLTCATCLPILTTHMIRATGCIQPMFLTWALSVIYKFNLSLFLVSFSEHPQWTFLFWRRNLLSLISAKPNVWLFSLTNTMVGLDQPQNNWLTQCHHMWFWLIIKLVRNRITRH